MVREKKLREKLQAASGEELDPLAAAEQEIARLHTLLGELQPTMHPEKNLPEEVTDPIFARVATLEVVIRTTPAETPADAAVKLRQRLAADLNSGADDLAALGCLQSSKR